MSKQFLFWYKQTCSYVLVPAFVILLLLFHKYEVTGWSGKGEKKVYMQGYSLAFSGVPKQTGYGLLEAKPGGVKKIRVDIYFCFGKLLYTTTLSYDDERASSSVRTYPVRQ